MEIHLHCFGWRRMNLSSCSKQMLVQQHHQIQNQNQNLTLIQLRNRMLHLQSSSLYPNRLWHDANSFDESNEISRKSSLDACDTSSSCHHQNHLSYLFWTLNHISSTHSFCSICVTCLKSCCVNAWIYVRFPERTISNEVTWLLALVATVIFRC